MPEGPLIMKLGIRRVEEVDTYGLAYARHTRLFHIPSIFDQVDFKAP